MYFLSYQDEYLENFVRIAIVSMVEAILMNLELILVQEQSHYSSIFLTFCKNPLQFPKSQKQLHLTGSIQTVLDS